jgi:hypothetical protein
MHLPDPRFRLREEHLRTQRGANKFKRAFMQLRKVATRELYVRERGLGSWLPVPVGREVLVLTVAFNSADLIRIQAGSLQRFLAGSYSLGVVDNSPDEYERERIRAIAGEFGIHYFSAPRNPYSWIDPSISHSLALDWAWRNIVRKAKPRKVLLLDHDVFLLSPASVDSLLGPAAVAGYKRMSLGSERWILWPGLLAFDCAQVRNFRISFMPKKDTDSGGTLHWTVYSKLHQKQIRFLHRQEIVFSPGARRVGDGSSGEVHLFDASWLHLVDGSGWSDGVGKLAKLPGEGPGLSLEGLIAKVEEIVKTQYETEAEKAKTPPRKKSQTESKAP